MDALLEPISKTERQQFCVEMMKRLDIQRRNEQLCDLILEVGSGDDHARLNAHRIVLCAASPFFYNALNSDMKEKRDGVIQLQETSKAVMQKVLEYFYTGHVEITEKDAFDMLGIADFLVLPSLKGASSKFISRSLSSVNALMAYYSAVRYRCPELEKQARDFVFANFMSVTESQDFLNLSMEQVEEWISSDEVKVKNEEEVFQVITKWMEREKSGDNKNFFELFRHVRVVYLSRNYVFNVILPHPLVRDNDRCTGFVLEAMKAISDGTEECFFSQPPRNCLKMYEDGLVVCGKKNVFCYVPTENRWYEMKPLSFQRIGESSLCACNGKLYARGTNSAGLFSVERYDPLANSWSLITSYSCATAHQIRTSTLVNFQGHLYAIGGMNNQDQPSQIVLKYSPETNLWQEVAPLSNARHGVCAVADKNSLYAIGGFSSPSATSFLDLAERFDPENNSWSIIAPTTEKKAFATGVIFQGKVFLIGGVKGYIERTPASRQGGRPILNYSDLVEMYDPATDTWTGTRTVAAPTFRTSAVSFKGEIFVLGHWKQGESGKRLLQIYDVDENEWRRPVSSPCGYQLAPLRMPRDVLNSCKVHEVHVSQN